MAPSERWVLRGLIGLMGVLLLACGWLPGPSVAEAGENAAGEGAAPARAPGPACPRFQQPREYGKVKDARLHEISGLVPAGARPSGYWVHNDSGDEARIYGLDAHGTLTGAFRVAGLARPEDFEDMAAVQGSAGSFLYLADIGDNKARRAAGVRVHRVLEPVAKSFTAPVQGEHSAALLESMVLRYPDGPTDAEALLVDPETAEVTIVTKAWIGWPKVYSAPWGQEATMALRGAIDPNRAGQAVHVVTGGAVSRRGDWVALRTYGGAFLFRRIPGRPLWAALMGPACAVPVADEHQGEAIGLLERPGGVPAIVTVSEGEMSPIYITEPSQGSP